MNPKNIFKYQLQRGGQTFQMPSGAQILSAQFQRGELCLWALVDERAKLEMRSFVVLGTGQPTTLNLRHISTVQSDDQSFVWHIFETAGA